MLIQHKSANKCYFKIVLFFFFFFKDSALTPLDLRVRKKKKKMV